MHYALNTISVKSDLLAGNRVAFPKGHAEALRKEVCPDQFGTSPVSKARATLQRVPSAIRAEMAPKA